MNTLNDKHEIFNVYKSSCSRCKNRFDIFNFTCKAFPEGVPDEILKGNDDHVQKWRKQTNDVVFESKQ